MSGLFDGFDGWRRDDNLPPDFPECVIDMIDALRNYRRWLKEWADGDPDSYGGWASEPDPRFAKPLREVEEMLADLEKWELLSNLKDRMKR